MSNLKGHQITEEQLKEMSIEECVRLRQQLQAELQAILEANPGLIQRALNKLNERIFEHSYSNGKFPNEAYEG